MNARRDDEVGAYKIVWVGLDCSKWFTKRLLAVDSREASMDTVRNAVSVRHTIVGQSNFLTRKSTICLLEGKREVGPSWLKAVILWIRERDISLLEGEWLIQVEALTLL